MNLWKGCDRASPNAASPHAAIRGAAPVVMLVVVAVRSDPPAFWRLTIVSVVRVGAVEFPAWATVGAQENASSAASKNVTMGGVI